MESPPSEAPPLSEDSGLLITSGSFSSDSASGWHHVASELQESDFDERSLSLCESTETSERMCGDFFNTVKKGPAKAAITTIEPPPEFQDYPNHRNKCHIDFPISETTLPEKAINLNVPATSGRSSPLCPWKLKPESVYERRQCLSGRFASPRLLHLSPCRARPASRTSLSPRLSSSHNSLVTQFQIDDSNFITQAISHDALSTKTSDITDMYNVPFDSDIYAVPIDVVQPSQSNLKSKGKKSRSNRKRGKSTPHNIGTSHLPLEKNHRPKEANRQRDVKSKRHSLPSSSTKRNMGDSDSETVNLTLREMRKYLHTVYSNSSSDSEGRSSRPSGAIANVHARHHCHVLENESPTNISSTASTAVFLTESKEPRTETNNSKKSNRNSFSLFRTKKYSKETDEDIENGNRPARGPGKSRFSTVRILKQSFCNLFRWRRQPAEGGGPERAESPPPAVRRALPPLPLASAAPHPSRRYEEFGTDFASSIEKVKDYGWYWGPISVEAAEKILSNEPDGSFIVRDSSDHHYIFTLTFKLNGLRHVRIEHHQGNFCFGGCTMFKASTIVEFIENAVETSRSGRYLFFLNQRPVLGPVRVQLLYPVSRFKRVQSLQHMCRFVILKHVRRDLIKRLPLPRRMLDYLNATHYYSELISDDV